MQENYKAPAPDLDAERLVLGAILTVDGAFPEISGIVTGGDFSLEKHRRIFLAAEAVYASGLHIDIPNVAFEMEKRGWHSQTPMSELTALDTGLPQIFDVRDYANRVKLDSARRKAMATLHKSLLRLGDPSVDLRNVLGTVESGVHDVDEMLRDGAGDGDLVPLGAIVRKHADHLLRPRKYYEGSISTPWQRLTDITMGFHRGEMTIIAARPGGGKSAMASQIAMHAAKEGKRVGIFSMEMVQYRLSQRMAYSLAMINPTDLNNDLLDRNGMDRLRETLNDLAEEQNLFICDTPGMTLATIERAMQKLSRHAPLDLMIVDYIGLIQSPRQNDNRVQEVSQFSRGLKLLTGKYNVAGIVLAQLNRSPEKENRPPRLSDLRDSGSIEQDADVVFFLHPCSQQYYALSVPTDLLIAKQRNGMVARVPLMFHRHYVKFELATEETAEHISRFARDEDYD